MTIDMLLIMPVKKVCNDSGTDCPLALENATTARIISTITVPCLILCFSVLTSLNLWYAPADYDRLRAQRLSIPWPGKIFRQAIDRARLGMVS